MEFVVECFCFWLKSGSCFLVDVSGGSRGWPGRKRAPHTHTPIALTAVNTEFWVCWCGRGGSEPPPRHTPITLMAVNTELWVFLPFLCREGQRTEPAQPYNPWVN